MSSLSEGNMVVCFALLFPWWVLILFVGCELVLFVCESLARIISALLRLFFWFFSLVLLCGLLLLFCSTRARYVIT